MIEGLPLPPANATAPHLSDPPIGPRPRHFVRLAHGINVRVARDPITTPAPCLNCRRKVLGEIACGKPARWTRNAACSGRASGTGRGGSEGTAFVLAWAG
jgi:hypothetical protein